MLLVTSSAVVLLALTCVDSWKFPLPSLSKRTTTSTTTVCSSSATSPPSFVDDPSSSSSISDPFPPSRPHHKQNKPFGSLKSYNEPRSSPFVSWEHLLTKHFTRTGKPLCEVPNFVSFCINHRRHAQRLLGDKDSSISVTEDDAFVPNLLHGGVKAGPIARTKTPGQFVRVLMAFPDQVLSAQPTYSLDQQEYHCFRHDSLAWVHEVSSHLPTLQEELIINVLDTVGSDDPNHWEALRNVRGKEWSDTMTGWSHIALVDNFRILDHNVELFPKLVRILEEVVGTERRIGPRLVAIAKQAANTGIPLHCDFMNFMLTMHMPLLRVSRTTTRASSADDDKKIGISINGTKYEWKVNAPPLVMDTTFPHYTYNESDEDDLYLLIVDFWHPDLSLDEIDALRSFFGVNSGV